MIVPKNRDIYLGDIYLDCENTRPKRVITIRKVLFIESLSIKAKTYRIYRIFESSKTSYYIRSYKTEIPLVHLSDDYMGIKINESELNKFMYLFDLVSKSVIKFPEVRKNEKLVKDAGVYAKSSRNDSEIKSYIRIIKNKNEKLISKELSFPGISDSSECNIEYKSYSVDRGIKVIDNYELTIKDWYKKVREYNTIILYCNYLFDHYYESESR